MGLKHISDYKTMYIYCMNCKRTQVTHFEKNLVLISKNKIKRKSQCAICLTEKTFIDEIEDKYDIESKLEVCLQFFTDSFLETEDLLCRV